MLLWRIKKNIYVDTLLSRATMYRTIDASIVSYRRWCIICCLSDQVIGVFSHYWVNIFWTSLSASELYLKYKRPIGAWITHLRITRDNRDLLSKKFIWKNSKGEVGGGGRGNGNSNTKEAKVARVIFLGKEIYLEKFQDENLRGGGGGGMVIQIPK